MKRTIGTRNELTLSVRCDEGRAQIDVGLDGLAPEERAFLYDVVRRTQRGGSVIFSLEPSEEGMVLKLVLQHLNQGTKVESGVKKALDA